jgi:RNA polymerase sigma-70 factor (ECF subfamily)
MGLVREGNHTAFAELLPGLGPAIEKTLRRYLPAAEIDDGRAEVHCRIWGKRHLYQEARGTVRAWVRSVSRSYALDWLRRNSGRPLAGLDGLAVADRHPGPAAAAEEADLATYFARLVSAVLAAFPPVVQVSFRMRRDGAGYAAIAAALGRPIGSIASGVHRVRTRLLALVKDNHHPCFRTEESPMSSIKSNRVEAPLPAERSSEPDTPAALAASLRARLDLLIADPSQHQSDTDWAEVEELVERLRPFIRSLPKRLFTKVVTRLRESRELLGEVAGHGAALVQIREVATLLQSHWG